jgi:hypothetical protein
LRGRRTFKSSSVDKHKVAAAATLCLLSQNCADNHKLASKSPHILAESVAIEAAGFHHAENKNHKVAESAEKQA